jgi:DNA-binding NarL/FixJ family response regulator
LLTIFIHELFCRYQTTGQAAKVMQRGCNGFIQKPCHMKELSKKIREIIDRDAESFESI